MLAFYLQIWLVITMGIFKSILDQFKVRENYEDYISSNSEDLPTWYTSSMKYAEGDPKLQKELKKDLAEDIEYKQMYYKHNQDEEYLRKYSDKCLKRIRADRTNFTYRYEYRNTQMFLGKLLEKEKRYKEALSLYENLFNSEARGTLTAETIKRIGICKRKLEKQKASIQS